ncbi:MAG TPA: VWA domain-containing protein [Thermoanaerobaculia bacterium]|nr:VWA domain-containing protein [Thermoanaerobaculia bacterium]
MRTLLFFLALTASPLAISAEETSSIPVQPIRIDAVALGDSAEGVVTRIIVRYSVPQETPADIPLVIQGSTLKDGRSVKNFRYPVMQKQSPNLSFIQTLPEGELEVEVRLLVPLEEDTPVLLGKGLQKITVVRTKKAYVASESDGAEGFIAEGAASEEQGAVKIAAPRRDLAPNLFIVKVDVKPPVKRVEFFVEGKKIFTRNAPPYVAELDLGSVPKRVEVRAVGYDAAGRYIDADAWVVNERDNPLEVKITRTETADGISHFKVSLQNPHNRMIKSALLFAEQKKIADFSRPPYAIALTKSQLAGVSFVRVSVLDDTGYEASDLLFLDGQRVSENIEVNLVELPISVTDGTGAAVIDLGQKEFTIVEDGKVKNISNFSFSRNLPLSIGVIVDHSGSMKERIALAKEAAGTFFKQIIGPADRGFAGGFSFDTSKLPPFTSSLATLEHQVGAIGAAEGGTSLYDAIVTGLYRFRSLSGRKALILVTDGEDTTSRTSYDDMLAYTRVARVPIYFIGIGMSALDVTATSKMKSLTAETGGVAYFVKDAKKLKEMYSRIEQELRTQYLVSYYTESTKNDSRYRTVEVKTSRKDVKVRTIRGFIP